MIRYIFSNNEIYLTNDVSIFVLQDRNPQTQQRFTNKDEAVTWAEEYVKELNETLTQSDTKLEETDKLEELETKVENQQVLLDSLSDTVIQLSMTL